MKFSVPFVAAAICLSPALSFAQDGTPSEPHCWASLPVVDTVRQVFEVHAREYRIWRNAPRADLPPAYLTHVATAIAKYTRLPSVVDSRAFAVRVHKDSSPNLAFRSTSAAVTFKLRPDGRVDGLHLHGIGASPGLETALAYAVIRADSAADIPPLPPGRYPRDLTLEISIEARPDSVIAPDSTSGGALPASASRPVAVGLTRVARYRLDEPARPIGRTQRVLYPRLGRQALASDSVALEFIVGEDGKAEVDRAVLVSAEYVEFATAVVEALPRMRFEPARVGDCRLRSIVRQSFVFRIAPSP